uniref:Uncharacterized protein n=1 Tax=Plectus sambesii TaxID=2011161 RepID=A0A914W4D9_9BILA
MAKTVKTQERNQIGFFGATSYVIGNIIGSGIFITPTSILKETNSVGLSMAVWAVSGAISLIGSLCYIELGTSIRHSGGDFAYICYVKWYPIAFAFMWVSILLTYPATIAVQAETFGEYILTGIDPLLCVDQAYRNIVQKLLGFSLLSILVFVNFFSLKKTASRFQIAATISKLLSTGIIIATGFYYLIARNKSENLKGFMDGSTTNAENIVLALYSGLFAYNGWEILNVGTEEIRNPKRNMPLAMLVGIIISAIIYLLINLAYFVVLDVAEMKESDAVAADFSQKVLGDFSYVIPFLVGVLLCGSLNGSIFVASRQELLHFEYFLEYIHAAARQGHLPTCLSCINEKTNSPRAAVFAQLIIAIAISFVGELDKLISYVTFAIWFQRFFTLCALIWIRYKKLPVHPGAIRFPLILIVAFLAICLALVLIPVIRDPKVTGIGMGIVASGLILYFIFVWPTNLPAFLSRFNESSTRFVQIIFNVMPDLGDEPQRRTAARVAPNVSLINVIERKRF